MAVLIVKLGENAVLSVKVVISIALL